LTLYALGGVVQREIYAMYIPIYIYIYTKRVYTDRSRLKWRCAAWFFIVLRAGNNGKNREKNNAADGVGNILVGDGGGGGGGDYPRGRDERKVYGGAKTRDL